MQRYMKTEIQFLPLCHLNLNPIALQIRQQTLSSLISGEDVELLLRCPKAPSYFSAMAEM